MADVNANQEMHREEVAAYLHEFADKLDAPGRSEHETADTTAGATGEGSSGERHSGADGEDTADQLREERTDSADRLREDETDENAAGETRDDATRDDVAHDDTAHDDATHESTAHAGEKVTFMVGNESATVNPPGTVDFEMAVDSDSSLMASGTRETVTFELQWNSEDVDEGDELDIQ